MRSAFTGFPPQAMTFFRGIARNNRREWFLPRKPIFEECVRAPMVAMVEALNAELMRFAPEYVTDPAKAIYRFYRDTRFSRDKSPYKTQIAASFSRRGAVKHSAAGYYFSVSAKEIEVGGGIYLPPPETLAAVRRHIAAKHEQFRGIAASREVRRLLGEVQGEQLARVPKGFCASHPAADLLKFKQYLLYVTLEPGIATTPALFTEVLARFRAMAAFIAFLNAPLGRPQRKLGVPVLMPSRW